MVSIWRSISRCLSGGRFGERLMGMIRFGRSELIMIGENTKVGNRNVGPRLRIIGPISRHVRPCHSLPALAHRSIRACDRYVLGSVANPEPRRTGLSVAMKVNKPANGTAAPDAGVPRPSFDLCRTCV